MGLENVTGGMRMRNLLRFHLNYSFAETNGYKPHRWEACREIPGNTLPKGWEIFIPTSDTFAVRAEGEFRY